MIQYKTKPNLKSEVMIPKLQSTAGLLLMACFLLQNDFQKYSFVALATSATTKISEAELVDKLFKNYNPVARPVKEINKTIQLELTLQIYNIKELNTKDQYISVHGWLIAEWEDELLTWNASEYNGVDYIVVDPTKVWIPSFYMFNTASDDVFDQNWYKLFRVGVSATGSMFWSPMGTFKAYCEMDIWMFPFDDQICYFLYMNSMYLNVQVNLTLNSHDDFDMLEYDHRNGQWEVINSEGVGLSHIPPPQIIFFVHLKRRSLFYITNIIVPSLMLAFLVIMSFQLPVESGEKISMGMTVFLSFSVFILMVNDMIPETSTSVPLITVYIICLMVITALSIVESIVVMKIYYHNGSSRIPRWLHRIVENSCLKKNKVGNAEVGDKEDATSNDNIFGNNASIDRIQKEWQKVARYIDKCFFYVFTFTFVVSVFGFAILILTTDVKDFKAYIDEMSVVNSHICLHEESVIDNACGDHH